MSAYRMYFLIWGQIQGREDFEAADDVAAIRIAGVLYDTYTVLEAPGGEIPGRLDIAHLLRRCSCQVQPSHPP